MRDMADLFGIPENDVREIVDELAAHDLLREVPPRKVNT